MFFIIFAVCFQANAQEPTLIEPEDQQSFENRINASISDVLMKKDLTQYADELARKEPRSFEELMRRIYVFERAGQKERANEMAHKLFNVNGYEKQYDLALETFYEKVGFYDSANLKIYVEKFIEKLEANSGSAIWFFIRMPEKSEMNDKIESWLIERYKKSPENQKDVCFNDLYQWRVIHGGVEAMRPPLRVAVEKNPQSYEHAAKYLFHTENIKDWIWLVDTFNSPNAYDYDRLAQDFESFARTGSYKVIKGAHDDMLRLAVKLYQRSLETGFSENDKTAMDSREFYRPKPSDDIMSYLSSRRRLYPRPDENYEKQLRYWTKHRLVRVYQQLKQQESAQSVLQDLADMDKDDIVANYENNYVNEDGKLTAKPSSKIIESKILQDEAAKRDTTDYWIKRIEYYEGIENLRAVKQSFTLAFNALPSKKLDNTHRNERLTIFGSLNRYAYEFCVQKAENCDFAKRFLEREFSESTANITYLSRFVSEACGTSFDSLCEKWAVENPDLLIRFVKDKNSGLLQGGSGAGVIFRQIAKTNLISDVQKQRLWNELENEMSGEFYINIYAGWMSGIGEYERAIRSYRLIISRQSNDIWNENTKLILFRLYLKKGDWELAETFRFNEMKSDWNAFSDKFTNHLEQIALVAAQQNAINDALRLWKIRANLDRREIDLLPELAKTKLKEPLRDFYSQMKIRDPQSTAPDAALEQLK